MRAVFRCDASRAIGGGHLTRCLALAQALDGWRVAIAGTPATQEMLARIGEAPEFLALTVDEADESEVLREAWPQGADLLIVDHYRRGAAFERAMRGWARRIVVIDDLADRPHDCDVLIDYSPGREARDYSALVQGGRVCAGPRFALLRPAFAAARRRTVPRPAKPVERIVVGFGAADAVGVGAKVREGVARLSPMPAIEMIDGGASAREVADSLGRADLAIGAPGVSALERCCLGLPSILITVADNQHGNATALEKAGAARALGWHADVTPAAVAAAVTALSADTAARMEMSANAARLCDGDGARRIAAVLAERVSA